METFNKVLSTIKLLVKSIVSSKIAPPNLSRHEIQQRLYAVIDDALKEINIYPKD